MAQAPARAVRDEAGGLVLYAPVVADEEFDAAVAYLVRRLDENAQPGNFLRALLDSDPDSPRWAREVQAFRAAVDAVGDVPTAPRRDQDRAAQDRALAQRLATGSRAPDADAPFANAADTDWTQVANRAWAAGHVAALAARIAKRPVAVRPLVAGREVVGEACAPPIDSVDPSDPARVVAHVTLATRDDVDAALAAAADAARAWAGEGAQRRRALLVRVGDELEVRRGELLAAMAHEAGKTLREGDAEVSEAVDFARWHAARAGDLDALTGEGVAFTPDAVTVVAGPWNFPAAIPTGGVTAALAAGGAAVLKPAPETPLVASVLAAAFAAALAATGAPAGLVALLPVADDEVGWHLLTAPPVARVQLTGAYATARAFLQRAPRMSLHAETSGKNALVVTATADVDAGDRRPRRQRLWARRAEVLRGEPGDRGAHGADAHRLPRAPGRRGAHPARRAGHRPRHRGRPAGPRARSGPHPRAHPPGPRRVVARRARAPRTAAVASGGCARACGPARGSTPPSASGRCSAWSPWTTSTRRSACRTPSPTASPVGCTPWTPTSRRGGFRACRSATPT